VRAKSVGVGDLIRQATFDRFLCRVFSVQPPKFVLKGGTGILARLSTSRATKDIDLSAGEGDPETAVADLSQLATVDLGDHFRFERVNRVDQLDGENQPYTAGCRLPVCALSTTCCTRWWTRWRTNYAQPTLDTKRVDLLRRASRT